MPGLRQGFARGTVGAMAMSGIRVVSMETGLLERPPPQQIFREKVPAEQARVVEELAHWFYGGVGGVMFALLPKFLKRAPAAGPAYGVALWLGYELVLAPALDLSHHKRNGIGGQLAVLADHAVYGALLSSDR
ncbi:MAG: DUF6789 family protein [Solirubrobacteraceae bacterium]